MLALIGRTGQLVATRSLSSAAAASASSRALFSSASALSSAHRSSASSSLSLSLASKRSFSSFLFKTPTSFLAHNNPASTTQYNKTAAAAFRTGAGWSRKTNLCDSSNRFKFQNNPLRRFNAAAENAKGGILAFPKDHPFATNIIIATLKTSACDILVQQYIEKKEKIDWIRVSVFTAFGCLYLGFFQWAIYVTLFGKLFPGMAKFANMPFKEKLKDTRGIINLCGQTAFDNFIHYTFIYFPVFYTFKEAIQGTGYEKTIETVTGKSMKKYKDNFWEDNMKIWGLWIPGDMIIYAVPMWMRLPLNHGLSFIWTCYLSFLRGGETLPDATEAAAQLDSAAESAAEAAKEDATKAADDA